MRFRNSLVRSAFVATMSVTLCFSATFVTGSSEFIVHRFAPPPNVQGCLPQGNLLADSAGNLYGTADCGASLHGGVVFKLTRPVPPNTTWTESVLYTFMGNEGANDDGSAPTAGVIFDPAGNLYGTTTNGGKFDQGTVFELSPPPAGQTNWTETVLHSFNVTDGELPTSGLVRDHSGNLYGVALGGLDGADSGRGVVYQLAPPASIGGAWTLTVLHTFGRFAKDGAEPFGNLVFDAKGDLYGTTLHGGESSLGVAYKLAPPAPGKSAWTFLVLHAF